MPRPRKNEKRNEFVARAVPILMAEGLSEKAAVGKAEGMFTTYRGRGHRSGKRRRK